jgi:hypothetical protein
MTQEALKLALEALEKNTEHDDPMILIITLKPSPPSKKPWHRRKSL